MKMLSIAEAEVFCILVGKLVMLVKLQDINKLSSWLLFPLSLR